MTTIELLKGKPVSAELMDLITKFTEQYVNTAKLWDDITIQAKKEGFTTEEMQLLIRPMLKDKLTKDQIYYLFHREEEQERSKLRYSRVNDAKKDTEQLDTQPIGKSIAQAVDVVKENLELKQEIDHLKKTAYDLREVVAKNAIETGDTVETNFDRLFEMLPSDDVDTFKNKSGTTLLFERLLVNFKYQKIPKLQWWVRVIK